MLFRTLGVMGKRFAQRFLPSKIAGLQLWLDATDTDTLNAKMSADFVSANSEYLSSASTDFQVGDNDVSLGGWYKRTGASGQNVIGKFNLTGNQQSYMIWDDVGSGVFKVLVSSDGSTTTTLTTTKASVLNTWGFFVCVYDSVNDLLKFSFDGGDFEVTAHSGGFFATSEDFWIGGSNGSYSDSNFDGTFFIDRAIPLQDVKSMWALGNGVSYYDFINSLNGETYALGASYDATVSKYLNKYSTDFDSDGTTSFSFGGWFYFNANLVASQGVVGRWGVNGSSTGSYMINRNAGINSLEGSVALGSSTVAKTALVTYSLNTWVHLTFVFEAGVGLSVYKDTVETFKPYTGAINNPVIGNTIGKAGYATSTPNMIVDSQFFYQKALSSDEVSDLVNGGTGVSYSDLTTAQKVGLTSWWDMNQTDGADMLDSHGTNDFGNINDIGSTTGKVVDTTIASIESDLVSWWELNELSGERFDAHGANNLTDNNSVGYALGHIQEPIGTTKTVADFVSASSEYLSTNGLVSALQTTTTGTVVLWAKPDDSTPAALQSIVGFGDTDANTYIYLNRTTSTGILRVICTIGGVGQWILTEDTLSAKSNEWQHIALTHNGTIPQLYVNGVLVSQTLTGATQTAWFNDAPLIDNFTLSSLLYNSTQIAFINEQLANVGIYDTNKSASEILALYDLNVMSNFDDLSASQQTDLVAWWNLDEESGNRLDSFNPTTNNAIDLDGSTMALNADALITPLASTTTGEIELLVKPIDATPTAVEYLISFSDTNGLSNISARILTSGKLQVFNLVGGVSQWDFTTDSAIFSDNTWTKLNIVHNGTTPSLLVDDVSKAITFSVSTDKTSYFNNTPLIDNSRIGCINFNSAGNASFFDGAIDSVKIWSDATQTTQIAEYSMNETSGNRVDSIGGYDATEIGTPDFISLSTMLKDNNTVGSSDITAGYVWRWTDKSSNAYNIDQDTAADQGEYLSPPKAINFDGVSDYYDITQVLTPLAATTVGTWACWAKVADVTATQNFIAFADDSKQSFVRLTQTAGTVFFSTRINGTTMYSLATDNIEVVNNTWVHIAVSQPADGGGATIYINGSAVDATATVATDVDAWIASDPLLDIASIGVLQWNGTALQWLGGLMADPVIYDTNLDAAQILKLANHNSNIYN